MKSTSRSYYTTAAIVVSHQQIINGCRTGPTYDSSVKSSAVQTPQAIPALDSNSALPRDNRPRFDESGTAPFSCREKYECGPGVTGVGASK